MTHMSNTTHLHRRNLMQLDVVMIRYVKPCVLGRTWKYKDEKLNRGIQPPKGLPARFPGFLKKSK